MVPEHMRVGPSTARFKLFARSRVTNITTRPVHTAMSSAARYHLRNDAHLVIQKGDITQWEGDAVVNAANERMLGGGGVDGAIHRAAGPALLEACKRYPNALSERCPTGDARVTLAYKMPCKWIIHTVGPIFNSRQPKESQINLISAYKASLAVANGVGATNVAFPAISCGIYGYPLQSACSDAVKACWEAAGDLKEIHFVLFGSDTYDVWLAEAKKRLTPVADSSSENAKACDASRSSPAQDEASPMEDTASPGRKKSSSGQQESFQGPESTEHASSVQTLTGVKKGTAGEAAEEALAAPEVLEAAEPAKETDLPGHSRDKDSEARSNKNSHCADGEDVGMIETTPDSVPKSN